jgi:hypothetical protein
MSYTTPPTSGSSRNAQFQNGHRPQNSVDLAKQYEVDMIQITRCLFQDVDSQGYKIEKYLSHVRIIEDSKSPSSRPPANSPQSNKKDRFLILSVKSSGRMRLHKGKESSSGIIQIGRSWDFDELTSLELDEQTPTGFICQMGKFYYWEVHTPKERRVWCTTLIENYIKYTNGKVPNLINCSVEYFHLEPLYDSFNNGPNKNTSGSLNYHSTSPKRSTPILTTDATLSPTKSSSRSFTNPQRSPIKTNSPDLTSLKRNLGTPPLNTSPYNFNTSSSNVPKAISITTAALAGTAAAAAATKNGNYEDENKAKLEEEKRKWENQKRIEKEEEEEKRKKQFEAANANELEQRRRQEIEKRRQQELERRKQEELERRRQEQEELDRQLALQEQEEKKKLEKQQELERLRLERENELAYQKDQFRPPRIAQLAKRGPPSNALSEAPSQMSFEYGDESKFQQHNNESIESDISNGINNYLDDYISDDADETKTAPLHLSLPKTRSRANAQLPVIQIYSKKATADGSEVSSSLHTTEEEVNKLLTPTKHLSALENKLDVSLLGGNSNNRSRAFSRVSDIEPDNNDLLEILEELGYDPVVDDSSSIQKKILKELDKLQYNKIQTLTQVTSVTSALKQTINTAFQNCDHVDPILSLFGVELSAFKEDVDYIEIQGQGLQVEATNEKLLVNELNELVHSVEISDLKLQKLLTSKITLGLHNSEIEKILYELYNALLKMSDDNNEDETSGNYQLSKMNALQEKKKIFEGARQKFIANFKACCGKLFESVSLSLTSKLEQIDIKNFDSNFLKTVYIDKLSSLLTINGMILFVKSVSISDYNAILNIFVEAFKPFFQNLFSVISKGLNQQVSILNVSQFSFNSVPSRLIDEKYMHKRGKKDFGKRSLFGTGNDDTANEKSEEENLITSVNQYCSQIINVLSIEQELIKSLFGLSSSSSLSFQNLVKIPLEKRCQEFVTISNFLNTPIESDRIISDETFEIMKQLFDSVFSSTLKIFLSVSKSNMLETPAILCLLKTYSQSLAPTSHEYSYSNFTKLESKVTSIWIKEVDQQTQEIMLTSLHCSVMNYVKAYPIFFNKIHAIVDSLNLVNIPTFGADEKFYGNYYMMWGIIKSALTKGITKLKIEIPIHEGIDNSNDVDANVSIQKHLTLLINYKWIFEEVRNLQEYPKDLSKSIDDLRDQELRLFVASFARQHSIGNIIRLVEDLENLISNNGNPGNLSTYSVENIKNMMANFKGDSFKQEIANISSELKTVLKGRCYNEVDSSQENKFSISIGEQIEKELYNNSMYTMCQLFISTFTKLSSIVDKYYENFEVPVDKYIINFNFKKHYTN